ncbi:MAG: trypsin-like peptidase domain-containing protein [Rhodobacter sp.]|nr:trypsin-like peptidase domain-containing protein [Rhodobacter sp.]
MTKTTAGRLAWLAVVMPLLAGGGARAQDRAWIQIEAQPTRAEAMDRARAYAAVFPDVAGYALSSGWFGIVLGPYSRQEAAMKLRDLRGEGLIASDSFLTDGRTFRDRYWPAGTAPDAPLPDPDPVAQAAAPEPQAMPLPQMPVPDNETPDEARAAEAALTAPERKEVQAALHWFGFYSAVIDGAFGPATRNAMAAWQEAGAQRATGVLTTAQRVALLSAYRGALAELGLQRVTEPEAGIEIDLPLAMIRFDRYDPPFVRYGEVDGSGVTVLLISKPGDETTLFGLFDLLQRLEIVPPAGQRRIGEDSFEITGRNERIESYSYAELSGGLVKGFTLVWPVADSARMAQVLKVMKAGFRPVGDRALDPTLAPMDAARRDGMLTGLEVRRPALSRSGFFIASNGTVLTTVDVLQSCARVTIDGDLPMSVALSDAQTGLAVLVPQTPLAPPGVAAFQTAPQRIGTEVAVAGYPYEDRLTSATLTFGFLEALEGLDGEADLKRFSLPALAGDAGGPVVDGTGAVIGMMLPRAEDAARQLPPDVSFALAASRIEQRLAAEGIVLRTAPAQGALAPDDLNRRARDMTVRVACWS